MHHNPVWTRRKISAYSLSVALRASLALGSQPGASSVPEAEENIRINSRADIKVRGVSSGKSSSAGVIDDSVTEVESSWASCGVRVSKGTRGVMTMQCLKYPQVQGLCIPSWGLFVNPKKRGNSRGSDRRKRGSYRPCRGPLGRGIRQGGPSSPGQAVESN